MQKANNNLYKNILAEILRELFPFSCRMRDERWSGWNLDWRRHVHEVLGRNEENNLFRRRRDTPDDSEYAPYAGTGPGFKKGKKGDKGDETLAYKAQLHHYQQAKQKIICGDDAPGNLKFFYKQIEF